MTEKNNGGPAFPLFDGSACYGGMTLRDWFAGMALQGEMSRELWAADEAGMIAKRCYLFADAFLKARGE